MAQVTQEEIQTAFAKYAPVFNRSGAQGGMQGYIDEGLSKFRYYDPLQVEVHNKAVDDQRNAVSAYKSLQQYSSQIQDVYDEVVNASNEYTQKGSARGYQSSILSAQNKLRKILSGISDNQRVLEDTGYISDDVRKYIAQVQQAVQELDSSIGESYKILQDEADFESKPKALQLLETAWKGIKAGLSRAGTGGWEFLIGDSSGIALAHKQQREDYEAMQDFLAKNVYKDGSFRGTGASRSFGKTPREKILDIVHKGDEAYQAELQQLVSFADNKMLAEAISSLGYSLGYMIPTMVTAGLTGGVEAPASVLSGAPFSSGTALSAVAQSTVANPSFWATAIPMYGNTYYEAKQEGATETEAQIAGLLNGFLGGVIETSGGIGALPTDETGVLVGIIRDALAEGGEEVAQGIVENAVASAIYRAETPTFSMDNVQAVINPVRALKEFALGTVAGGLFGSAKAGIGAVASKAASGIQSRRAGTVTPLVNTAIQGVTEPESAYLAQGATQAQSVPRATGAVDIDIAQTAQINPEVSQQVTSTAIDAEQTAIPMELTEEQKAVKSAADRIGVRVEFDHTGVGDARIENNIIHIRPDAANVRTLFVHELTHYLENSNRYFDLMNFVMDGEVFANWLGEGVTQAQYRDAIIRQYAEQGIQLDEAGANKEMLARFISENLFQNQNAIEQLAVKNRGLFDTIRNWIRRMVELFKGTPQERALRKIERMYKNALDGTLVGDVGKTTTQYSVPSRQVDSTGRELTPEQAEFFKDSKVRDADGNLLVVYHGGKFNKDIHGVPNTQGSGKKAWQLSFGMHFAEDKTEADNYINRKNDSVTAAYLNIKNPLDIYDKKPVSEWVEMSKEYYDSLPSEVKRRYNKRYSNAFNGGYGYIEWLGNTLDEMKPADAMQAIKDMGYDGVIYSARANYGGGKYRPFKAYIAFYPEQIKSVDNLNPTSDPDIRYSIKTPTEIADLTESSASTTPELKRQANKQVGKSESKFFESIQASSIFDDRLKSLAANDMRIKYYESIANAEIMNEANTELNNGGEKYVTDWFKKDPKTANPKDVATGFILMYRYQAIGDYESAIAVAQKLRNMGTNAGQTVQMFSILGRFTPDGMVMYAQKSLDEAFETMVKGRTQAWIDANKDKFKLTNEDIDFIRRRTWQAAQLPEGRDKRILLGEIAARIQNKIPPQKGQNIRALQRIALLLNPKTNVRNVLGNVIITPMHIVSDFFAAPIDKLISKKTGVRTTGLYDISSVKGFKKGFYESYDDFRRQINTRDIEANRFEIGEGKSFSESHKFKPLNALSKALNALDRTTTFLLGAEDRPFFEMWFINSSNNQMRLNNVTTPTAEMIEIARQDALSRTWQDTNNYTRSVSAIKKALNHIRIPGLNYGLGDIVIKFVKTPANLTKAIVDFSPVGLVKALSVEAARFTNAVKTGQVTPQMQRNFVRNLGNGIAGSLLYLIVHALVSSGKIELTGDESERDKETDFSRNVLGVQSYSVKIGDKYYAYDWAQPVAATLAIIADFMEDKHEESEDDAFQNILDALRAGGKVLFDQSFLQSINIFFEADDPIKGILKAVLNEPAAFVPQLFSQFASLGDDTVRTSYVYGDDLQTSQNKIKAKIPGLRQQLEPVVDVLGRDVENKNNVFDVFFNPSNVNAMKETPEGSEMYRVYSVTGETGALPSTAPYYVMKNNKKIILTPEQRTQYQRITGQTAVNLVSNLLNNVQYQNLSYKEKADVLSRINSYSRALANKQVLDIEPSKEMKSVFEAEEAGIPMSEYLLYRAMIRGIEADKDKEGKPISGTKKSKILDVINSLNLTREQKDFLYFQQDYKEKELKQAPWHKRGSYSLSSSSSSNSSTDWLYNFWGGVLGGN